MKFKKIVFLASLAMLSLVGKAESKTYLSNLPVAFQRFQSLDFDERMILKEKLCQQNNTDNFSDIVTDSFEQYPTLPLTLTNYKRCFDIVQLGCPLCEINPEKQSAEKIAGSCGFKRLAAFLNFCQEGKKSSGLFLENKDAQYVSALIAEEKNFSDILNLYDFNLKTKLWQKLDTEIKLYKGKNPNIRNLEEIYWNHVKQRAKAQLNFKKTPTKKAR